MGQNILSYYGFLNKGMYDHFILNRYENDLCSVKSEDSEELSVNIANIKPRKTKFAPQSFHNCTYCGKWYRSKTSLGLHRRLECGKEPAFQCPFCPLKTHQKGNLQVHIKKKHTQESAEGIQTNSNSLKNKNPILAQELGMMPSVSVNAQNLGINKEISSELTITRTQQSAPTRTPNLSHILSQPNKARGITQFPLSVSEINAAASSSTRAPANEAKIRVRSLLGSLPTVTQKKPFHERVSSDITITPTIMPLVQIQETFSIAKESNGVEIPGGSSCDGVKKGSDVKKLPELTRILNSQDPITPIPVPVEALSAPSSSSSSVTAAVVKNEPVTEDASEETPDSTDKDNV